MKDLGKELAGYLSYPGALDRDLLEADMNHLNDSMTLEERIPFYLLGYAGHELVEAFMAGNRSAVQPFLEEAAQCSKSSEVAAAVVIAIHHHLKNS